MSERQRGPVAVLAQSDALGRHACRLLERAGWGCSVHVTTPVRDAGESAAALDAAARHRDVGAILLVAPAWERPLDIDAVLRAVVPHVPIVATTLPDGSSANDAGRATHDAHDEASVPGTPEADRGLQRDRRATDSSVEPLPRSEGRSELRGKGLLDAWLRARNVRVVSSLDDAVAEAAILATVDPPAGSSAALVAADERVLDWMEHEARRAGWRAHREPGDPSAIHRLADSGAFDVVVAFGAGRPAPRSLASTQRTGAAPVVWLGGPSPSAFGYDAEHVCMPFQSLAWLRDWGAAGVAAQTPTIRDRALARQLAQQARRDGVRLDDAARWASALGLPAAEVRRVRYVEDALIVAAEIGYPVRLGLAGIAAGPERTPADVRADRSETLLELADALLAAARRLGHDDAWLTVDRWGPAPTWVVARRDPSWGSWVDLRREGAVLSIVAPLGSQLRQERPTVARCAGLVLAALAALPDIAQLGLRTTPAAVDDLVDRVYVEWHD